MAEREIKIGLASYIKADSPVDGNDRLEPQWGFGLFGATVDVHDSDVARFDRLNGPAAAPVVPLPPELEVDDGEPIDDEPPRAGRGSSLEAWVAYAEARDIEVPEDASRDDVIALVDAEK